MRAHDEEEQ